MFRPLSVLSFWRMRARATASSDARSNRFSKTMPMPAASAKCRPRAYSGSGACLRRWIYLPSAFRLGLDSVTTRSPASSRPGAWARSTGLGTRSSRREVAIKRVGAEFADPRAANRLIREAQHASSLKHPNICRIYEVGNDDGVPFIVMELIDGGRSTQCCAKAGPLLPRRSVTGSKSRTRWIMLTAAASCIGISRARTS